MLLRRAFVVSAAPRAALGVRSVPSRVWAPVAVPRRVFSAAASASEADANETVSGDAQDGDAEAEAPAAFSFWVPGEPLKRFRGRPILRTRPHEKDAELYKRQPEFDWHLEIDDRFNNIPQTGPRKDLHPIHRGHYTPGARVAPKALATRTKLFDFVYAQPGRPQHGLSLLGLGPDSIGRYFPVSDALLMRLPEGFRAPLKEELAETGGFMMQRPGAYQLVQGLKTLGAGPEAEKWVKRDVAELRQEMAKAGYSGPASLKGKLVGVTGQSGCGKSVTLIQTAMAAHQLGHIVIASWGPDAWNDLRGFIRPSLRPESFDRHPRGIYDQYRYSAAYLQQMILNHGPELTRIPLRHSYPHFWQPKTEEELQKRRRYRRRVYAAATNIAIAHKAVRENPDAELRNELAVWGQHCADWLAVEAENTKVNPLQKGNRTLFDLAAWGATNEEEAQDVLFAVFEELRLQRDVPVTVVIDNLNGWDTVSDFHEPETVKRLERRQLGMVDALWRMVERPPVNGTVVFGLTGNASLKKAKGYLDRADKVVDVTPYTDKEISQAMVHYAASSLLQLEVTRRAIARCKAFTGAVPRDVLKYVWML